MQMEEDGDYAPTFVRTKPRQTFAYIDYPGYVSPAPASTRKALKQMGGLPLLERVLTGKPQANDFIELKLRPTNALGHPVPGTTVEQNQIVLKVVTRKRKVLPGVTPENSGVYTVEYAGVTQQATYFRAMADYQVVTPSDDITNVANAVRDMNVDAMQAFQFNEEPSEEFDAVNIIPAPAFSRSTISHVYEYKSSPTSVPDTHTTSTGVTYARLKNVNEWKASAPQSIAFDDAGPVPTGPTAEMVKESDKDPDSQPVENRLMALLRQRPVWTRPALTNHLTVDELRTVTNKKRAIPMVSYTFSNGAFRDMVIRFSYDPRTDYQARLYQHLVLRNVDNKYDHAKLGGNSTVKASAEAAAAARKLATKYHIFDGVTMPSPIGNYQLIDITWQLAKKIVNDPRMYVKTPSGEDGFWIGELFDIFRRLIKRKQAGLLKNEPVTDDSFADLLAALEEKLKDIEEHGRDSISKRKKQKRIALEEDGEEEEDSDEEEEAVETDEGSTSAGSSAKGKSKAKSVPRKIGGKKLNILKPHWEQHQKKKNAPKPATMTEAVRAQHIRDKIGLNGDAPAGSSNHRSRSNESEQKMDVDEEEEEESDDE